MEIGSLDFLGTIYKGVASGEWALIPLAVTQISIHIQPAERSLERVKYSIVIFVQFLKMIMKEIACPWIVSTTFVSLKTRVIPLRVLQHSMVRQVGLWLGRHYRLSATALLSTALRQDGMLRFGTLHLCRLVPIYSLGPRFRSCLFQRRLPF
jgi:hypothetical protein